MDIPRVAASAGEAAAGALEPGKLARLVADFDRVGLRAPTTRIAPTPPTPSWDSPTAGLPPV